MRCNTALACAALVLTASSALAGTLQRFDLPGHPSICGAAINDDGVVVGNTLGIERPVNFVYRANSFTLLPPASITGFTAISGISGDRVLVGTNTVFGRHFTIRQTGFSLRDGTVETLHIKGAVQVIVRGISENEIVGSYQTSLEGPTLGFLQNGQILTVLDDGTGNTQPQAVDQVGGRVVGISQRAAVTTSWLYQAGKFTPIARPGAQATFASGVDRSGTISGSYMLDDVSHGFLLKAGKYSTYDVPGAFSTWLAGLNGHGAVTGCYTDSSGVHGLIYTP